MFSTIPDLDNYLPHLLLITNLTSHVHPLRPSDHTIP